MNSNTKNLRVAIIGSGPAGIYSADILLKTEALADYNISIDIFEKMPAPFGLIRYGVAPDHPRIKGIIASLHKVMDKPQIRLFGHVEFGKDITLEDLRKHYNIIIFSTGALADKSLEIPGIDAKRSYGAADFVAWYDGNPDFPRTWELEEEKVAVIGVGNVGLDVARILAKTADELLVTEIPDNVYQGLKLNKAKEVHIFGRRGPAQVKFTPLELKELDHSPNIEVIISPEDIDYDAGSIEERKASKICDQVASILENYAIREHKGRPHKLFIHFFESPTEVVTENGEVVGIKTERTELDGTGNVRGTGKFTVWPTTAIYRAVGYLSDALPGIPFDNNKGVISNSLGRVLDESKTHVDALYTTGWIKRGPVGLIGNTKGDALETVSCIVEDLQANKIPEPQDASLEAIDDLLKSRGVIFTTWDGWKKLDAHERSLGEATGRERIKVVEREDMVKASNHQH